MTRTTAVTRTVLFFRLSTFGMPLATSWSITFLSQVIVRLPASVFADAQADAATEEDVVTETRSALDRGALGTPTMALSQGGEFLLGPVLGEVPSGAEALAVWDGVLLALRTPTLYELKRGRKSAPSSQFAD